MRRSRLGAQGFALAALISVVVAWPPAASAAEKDPSGAARELLIEANRQLVDVNTALISADMAGARKALAKTIQRIGRSEAMLAKKGMTAAERQAMVWIGEGRALFEETVALLEQYEKTHKINLKAHEKEEIEKRRAAARAAREGTAVAPEGEAQASDGSAAAQDEEGTEEPEETRWVDEEADELREQADSHLRDGRVIFRRGLEAFPQR